MGRIDRPALPTVTPPPWILRATLAVRRGVARVHAGMALPVVRLLEQTTSMAEVQATAVFARLGVADHLASGPRSAQQLASAVDVDGDHLDRLLRFLATRGVVARRGGTYRLTSVSDLLRSGHPQSMRDWITFQGSAWQWHAWEELGAGLATADVTPFSVAHGRGFFEHLAHDPMAGASFDAAMRSTSRLQASLVAPSLALDDVEHLCDVGGGTGMALATLLQAHPHMRGTLFDLPHVIDRARDVLTSEGVMDRVELVAGDMFTRVPPGADRYLLSAIVHDWPDEAAVRILRSVGEAMGDSGRALVAELELPAHDGAALERSFDLLMLVLGGGRERTRDQFEQLYRAADMTMVGDTTLANGWHVHELANA
jgi:hypothetical protein